MQVAYLLNPVNSLNAKTDSTVELIRTHAKFGDKVFVVGHGGLSLNGGNLSLHAQEIVPSNDDKNWCTLKEVQTFKSSDFDLIAIRFEPPVDSCYRNLCQMLTFAQKEGTVVVNSPDAIMTQEEKLNAFNFPELNPLTLASTNKKALLDFCNNLDDGCIIKPLGLMGGKGVFSFDKGNTNIPVAIDFLLAEGGSVIAQQRLKEIVQGDRRVFIINGKPFKLMLNRLPAANSHLGNMLAGGTPEAIELGADELTIGEAIGPSLVEAGIIFAGIDVIGGKLTEINITCPTGLRSVRDQTGVHIAQTVVETYRELVT